MINKNIEEITRDDLQALINNAVLERKTLEYKKLLPGNSDSAKKEFLADVTSFANASGGDLIFGVIQDSKTGIPKALEGITVTNNDEEKTRLDNLIRTGVQPRLPSAQIRDIPLENSKIALIIRTQKSWISPHRVILGGHDKFYSRNSSGKYPLDVGELRIAFNLSETIIERINYFRTDRITKILSNETPVPFYDNPKIVLHLIPITSFNPSQRYDIDKTTSDTTKLKPIYCQGWNDRYNLDGFLNYTWTQEKCSHSYVQFYRNGIIEAVEGLLLEPLEKDRVIPSVAYEKELIISLNSYFSFLKALNIMLPIIIFLTMLQVKGYSMAVSKTFMYTESHKIDRDILLLPEIILENYESEASQILKPIFDSVWNACGFQRSFNYNEQGEWAPR